MDYKMKIAARVAKELKNGDVVNLGIGIPTMVTEFLPKEINVFIHSENGILGVGPTPRKEEVDPDLVNAGKQPVTVFKGASYFDSASSFGMIRGGHIDVAVLGALEVEQTGRIANWALPGQAVLGVGGAMDLLEGTKRVIVATTHTTKEGNPKLVKSTNLPITSNRKVDLIVTELAVFLVREHKLILIELQPEVSLEEVIKNTEADFLVELQKQSN